METDIGTIKTEVDDIQAEVVPTGYEFGLLATILALLAAIGAWLSAIFIRRKPIQLFQTETPKTETPKTEKPKKKPKTN